jgi:DNA-binding NarL/FixJ family response regulator
MFCSVAGKLRMSVVKLTLRELQMLILISQGLSNKCIGHRLNLSEGTIKVYLHNMYRKVGCPEPRGPCCILHARGELRPCPSA